MNLLARRLYNGGFNHLKSTSHLLRKASNNVGHPALARSCSVAAVKLAEENDAVRTQSLSSSVCNACTCFDCWEQCHWNHASRCVKRLGAGVARLLCIIGAHESLYTLYSERTIGRTFRIDYDTSRPSSVLRAILSQYSSSMVFSLHSTRIP